MARCAARAALADHGSCSCIRVAVRTVGAETMDARVFHQVKRPGRQGAGHCGRAGAQGARELPFSSGSVTANALAASPGKGAATARRNKTSMWAPRLAAAATLSLLASGAAFA